ncbi:hypothetical protein [Amycolatopsis sp. NBRC 101858]|uniref:hypothetical protein n=1 Tax=Amycolatopsis sp. NBRC 101858 TaxID=3032200 RepID=UPI0025531196|nr:hypothetical protein [Amycolatopsis sp. NBRC 101858]
MTITGTRSIGEPDRERVDSLFEAYLRPFADAGTLFHVGGAVGIDTFALSWLCDRTNSELCVVVPCTVTDQPAEAAAAISACRRAGRLVDVVELRADALGGAAYHARNRWMVDRSELVIGFPRGTNQAQGTWYTLNYAAEQGKPRLVVPL